MRLLLLTSHLNIGGVTSAILAKAKGLTARGHRITVASGGGALEPRLRELGVDHWRVSLHTKAEFSPQVWLATQEISRRLQRNPVDLLHAHTRVAQVAAARLSRRHRIPYVTTWHGFFRPNLGRRLWPCIGDRAVAVSEAVRRHLLEEFQVPPERVCVIHNGIDVDHYALRPDPQAVENFRRQWGILGDRPVVGSVGRLASGGVKGFDLLLSAAAIAKRQLPELEILLIGDGPRRTFLEHEAERLGIRDRTHFAGATLDVRVPLAALNLFLFSSRWNEGFGLSLIEAMAAGRPVVASATGAVPEIIEHNREGWLVAPNDAEALAQAIVQLLGDRAAASRLGAEGQRRVREEFHIGRMVQALEAVYEEIVPHEPRSKVGRV